MGIHFQRLRRALCQACTTRRANRAHHHILFEQLTQLCAVINTEASRALRQPFSSRWSQLPGALAGNRQKRALPGQPVSCARSTSLTLSIKSQHLQAAHWALLACTLTTIPLVLVAASWGTRWQPAGTRFARTACKLCTLDVADALYQITASSSCTLGVADAFTY